MRSRSHRRFKCLHLLLIRSDFSHTLQSLWSVTVLPALPAENLRLDRPLLLSRVSRFAPINANCAPLTARTARRLAPLGRAFAFYAPLCASPLRSKDPNQRKEFFRGNNLANNLLSSWVRSSQHRALWPRLRRQGNSRGSSSRATSTASGEICPTRTGRKTTTA